MTSTLQINGATTGNALQTLLVAPDIQPGDEVSYQLCKEIYAWHPMGAKLADFPIAMAQFKPRKIAVPDGPEDVLVEAFEREWKACDASRVIFNVARLARVYGVSTLALLVEGVQAGSPVNFEELAGKKIAFNVFDPLNTAGSLVLNQDPNAFDFQKSDGVTVQGVEYHPSRTVTIMNEDPIYIGYTQSAFGYVGRSVYQRALYPLKSFINTQITNDMIALKAGVLIATLDQQSSAVDKLMANIAGQKRDMVKGASVGNVISIAVGEDIQSLNLQNLDGAFGMARKNIIEDIATAAGTPSKLLLSETFAEGFGEGTEDAKHVAQYIQGLREWMQDLYDFMDTIVQYRAWNPEFYETIQARFPEEYGKKDYKQAFYAWRNGFKAEWPPLLEEPDSEKIKVDEAKMEATISMVEVLLPQMDPENKVRVIQWACDNFNSLKLLFDSPLELDWQALENYEPPQPEEPPGEPAPPKPKALTDAVRAARKRTTRREG